MSTDIDSGSEFTEYSDTESAQSNFTELYIDHYDDMEGLCVSNISELSLIHQSKISDISTHIYDIFWIFLSITIAILVNFSLS